VYWVHTYLFEAFKFPKYCIAKIFGKLSTPEAEVLDEIHTKILRVFLLAIHSHLYSFALGDFYFFKLTQPLTVSTVQLLHTVKENGGKPDGNHNPFPMV
jgi:hypothetical protein